MQMNDRRREPRTREERPVYVQLADPPGEQFEEVRTMTNFNRNGFYFVTPQPSYRPGMQLYAIPAFSVLNLEYMAEVVLVEPLGDGDFGVAVRLMRVRNLIRAAHTATICAFQSFASANESALMHERQLPEPYGGLNGSTQH